MKINQLSLFIENKPGCLIAVCRTLAEAEINILTLSLADTKQFAILRLVVEEWKRGQQVLEAAGFVVNLTEMVALEIEDRPGGLAEVLGIIESGYINIEYLYAFTAHKGTRAVFLFRFNDPDAAIRLLKEKGIEVMQEKEFFAFAKK